ncbi:MAG: DUF2279 domain-containing protein [Candidatus Handelsmanbacteria bacterium]|nr:DUF2279 domain-containing protein [Candidatus Handelsmanbacteria bacterium]
MTYCPAPPLSPRPWDALPGAVARLTRVACCLLLPWAGAAHPQAAPDSSGLRPARLAVVGGAGLGIHYLGFKYFDRAWYQGQKLDHIRWIRDWSGDTYLNVDKGGHFMSGMFMAQTLTNAYAWGGLAGRLGALAGTLSSWALLLEIEMRDAYFDQWGFSIPDFTANTIGATVPLVRALWPASQAVRFQFGYWPSRLYLDRRQRQTEGRPFTEHLIDDYEGMTVWMAVSVDRFLRGRAEEVWPDFLGLALGYGAAGLHGSNVKSKGRFKHYKKLPDGRPELLVALDLDPRFLPGDQRAWRYFKEQLRWLHLPAPALRIYPDWRFYLLY